MISKVCLRLSKSKIDKLNTKTKVKANRFMIRIAPQKNNEYEQIATPAAATPAAATMVQASVESTAISDCFDGITSWFASLGNWRNELAPINRTDDIATQSTSLKTAFLASEKLPQLSCVAPIKHIIEIDPKKNIIFHYGSIENIMDQEFIHATMIFGVHTYNVQSMGSEDGALLGRGCFGRVLVGTDELGRKIAIKISHPKSADYYEHRLLKQEALTQLSLHGASPYVLGAEASAGYKGLIFIVMEHQTEGDLVDFVKSSFTPPFKFPDKKSYLKEAVKHLRDAAEGLEYMHSHNLIHRDIKLENIMRDTQTTKIIDFGFTTTLPKGSNFIKVSSPKFTTGHAAPEIFSHKLMGKSSDVFAFGASMYQAFSGTNIPISSNGCSPDVQPKHWEFFKTQNGIFLTKLIQDCLSFSPDERPSISSVKRDLEQVVINPSILDA